MRTNRRRLSILLLTVLVVAPACGSDDGGGDAASPSGADGGKTITISNFEFAPEVLEVKVGDTITVANKDSAEHTVTAKDKSFDTGRFASGTKTFTVTKAGRFEYVCTVHPFMPNKFIQVVG